MANHREGTVRAPEALLLERSAELNRLRALLDQLSTGFGSVAFVEGEAGIGKTRLIAEAARAARERGFEVLFARGGELDRDFAFGIARQLVERSLPGADELLGPLEAPTAEPGFATLHGLSRMVLEAARERPLLLCVDDAHWADPASLRWLAYLARRVDDAPVMLALGARAGEPDAPAELLADIALSPAATRIALRRLRAESTAHLIRSRIGEAVPEEACAACHVVTAGNPFMVTALADALAHEGLAPEEIAADDVERLGAATLARAVFVRLARLPPPAARLARAASFLTPGAELRHVAKLAELDEHEAAHASDLLVDISILAEGRPLDFAHPLTRAAIYADVPASERAAWHARAASILAADGARPEQVATHLLRSDPARARAPVETLRAAAADAIGRGAPDAAVDYLRRALAEPPPAEEEGDVLAELGAAELAAGALGDAAEHLRVSASLTDDRKQRAVRLAQLWLALLMADRVRDLFELADDLAGEGGGSRPGIRFQASLAGTAFLIGSAGRRWVPVALEVAERGRDPAMRDAFVLAVAAASAACANRPAEEYVDVARRARRAEPPVAAGLTVVAHLATSLMVAEQYDQAREVCEEGLAEAGARGAVPDLVLAWTFLAQIECRVGRLREAEAAAREGADTARLFRRSFQYPGAVAALVDARCALGAFDAAQAALEESGLETALIDNWHGAFLSRARARLRAAQGRHEEALAELGAFGDRFEHAALRSPVLHPWRSEMAHVLVAVGRSADAAELAHRELAAAREARAPRAIGMAMRAAAAASAGPDRLRYLEEAVQVLRRSPSRVELALATLDLGAALRRGNRRADARAPLREALDIAEDCGSQALAQAAWAELAATGERVRRPREPGDPALTPSESRIAEMAAQGMKNREIARALFVTVKNVELHLSNAYRKLGIRSRGELADALAARGRND